MPDICFKCRAETSRNGRGGVPCEQDGICSYTGIEIDGFMSVNSKVFIIAQMWLEITTISGKQKYEKLGKEGAKTVYYFPTLEFIEPYLSNQDFDILEIDKKEAFYLISIFHITYLGTIQ